MNLPAPPTEGQILTGPLFNEPMHVETVTETGPGSWTLGLVGTRSERFRRVSLGATELAGLTVLDSGFRYDGDGALLRLGLQAHALGIAWEFDPYFGLSVSRVDPLPHQLEAVYDHLLKLPRVRFLLADDAGAGKTIMAGLLIRELQLRGLAERILIVAPSNLAFQWQRELQEKFDETFMVLKGGDLRAQFGVNQWMQQPKVVTSLDLAPSRKQPGTRSPRRGWRTHGLPPQSGTVTADTPPSASPRSAVSAGTTSAPAGGTTGETRCLSQALRLQVVAARASRSPSTTRSAARPGRGLGRRTRRDAADESTPGSTSRPTTASSSPERSPATAGGTGTDVRGDRPGRSPQVALERHHAAPSCGRGRRGHGSRAVRPPEQEATSTDAGDHCRPSRTFFGNISRDLVRDRSQA